MSLTATQIDKLGERLRQALTEPDLHLLDDYRNSFAPASTAVLRLLRQELLLTPTARPAKSTRAILAKLHREGTRHLDDAGHRRLSGCRRNAS